MITSHQATYYAHELTRRSASDDPNKLGASLYSATVDLNPHQVDAALFAFRSPLSRGAILADEVGLGKTIEAGLLISQLWAERKRRILVICPTILRKQWAQELSEKFHLDSLVLDGKEYNSNLKSGLDPFRPRDQVVICSYNFVQSKEQPILTTPWDLVVIDEAHRLRNVWKPGNKIASSIKRAVSRRPIILLTATPLQNNLLELYGLVSLVDDHIFGDVDAFKARYMRGPLEQRELRDLKNRLAPVCQRTLRRQVQEYVKFTARIPITEDFTPTEEEQRLYRLVSEYLQRDDIQALPASQRKLMTLVLRKLLASSTFAIGQTLGRMIDRIKEKNPDITGSLEDDFETLDELADELQTSESLDSEKAELSDSEVILSELRELAQYRKLAESITVNSKGEALLKALRAGFEKLSELGAAQKAVIFTESRRTQEYLVNLLSENGYADRFLTVNGTNSDDRSGAIYKQWLERHKGESVVSGNKAVDLRAALVEHFKLNADILIATEAAAEGVNLQFCSLVVNYDLPWNPQRIEQRIGRCHRYGQKHDVVVINFLNRTNEADMRVFQLLEEKFKLFDGVFGSSDEVLGALESGVDFEQRILDIYQNCRNAAEIDAAFDELQSELEEQIKHRMMQVESDVLANLDETVRKRLRIRKEQAEAQMGELEQLLWKVAKAELNGQATFDEEKCEFNLEEIPAGLTNESDFGIEPGRYVMLTKQGAEGAKTLRLGHPLAEAMLELAKGRILDSAEISFVYEPSKGRNVELDAVVHSEGYLQVAKLEISSELDQEDRLLFAVTDLDGNPLRWRTGKAILNLPAVTSGPTQLDSQTSHLLSGRIESAQDLVLGEVEERKSSFFTDEIEKLERWADDLKHGLEVDLKDLDKKIRELSKQVRQTSLLEDKLVLMKEKAKVESELHRKRRELFAAQDEIEGRKQSLIDDVELRINTSYERQNLMSIKWKVISPK